MEFLFISIILLVIFEANNKVDTRKFVKEVEPYLGFLMEADYKFLARLKYGATVDIEKLYEKRLRDGALVTITMIFIFLSKINFISIVLAFIIGFIVFKSPYMKLTKYYKNNLHQIDLLLPYYLKSLEILVQHYTVPVALARSVSSAPEIFKHGLQELVAKVEQGDSTVDPYMDFAKEYPVRDSMRMMRLLYRLGLGSNENKQEQLMMFSKTVSSLQAKAREQKYKARLDKMENQTMLMLGATGGGILLLMLLSLTMMMQF